MRVKVQWWVLSLALLALACGETSQLEGRVRAASAAPDSASAELRVDNRVLAIGQASKIFGKYYAVPAGEHVISVIIDGIRVDEPVNVEADLSYTVIHAGTAGRAGAILTDGDDDLLEVTADSDAPNLRFVHGSSAAGLVDVYLGPADKALSELAPLTFDLKNGDVTPFKPTDRGTYRLRLTKATQIDQIVYDSGPFALEGQGNLSFVLLDVPGGTGANALKFLVLTDEGSWPLGAFDTCTSDTPDENIASAKPFTGSFVMNGLCRAGDVDFYRLEVPQAKLAVIEVSTVGLNSPLSTTLELQGDAGVLLDKAAQSAGKARTRTLVFGGQAYFIRVADARAMGGPGNYELRVSLLDESPTVEAAGGMFNAASTSTQIAPFAGQFVALSARRTDNSKALDYKVMVRVTGLGASRYDFVYDPALAADGILRVILSDGTNPLPHVKPQLAPGGLIASQLMNDEWFVAMPALAPRYRASRAMGVAFPTKDITWTANTDSALTVPTVTGVQLNDARNSARVTFAQPARATTFELTAFGRIGAATGRVATTRSPVSVVFDAPLAVDEGYAVRVQAGDTGLIKLPLGNKALNVSEFLFYSDAE